MTHPPTLVPPRLPRLPLLILLLVVPAGFWLLAGHQPAPRLDVASPWFTFMRGLAPGARAVDALDLALPLGGDVAAGALLVLGLLGASVLATLLAADVPLVVAAGVTVGVLATRSLWGTVGPGGDALPVLVMSVVALTCHYPASRLLGLAGAALGVTLVTPALALVCAPLLALSTHGRWRRLLPLALLSAALASLLLQLSAAWGTVPCLAEGAWSTRLSEALWPGLSAGGSRRLALSQWLRTVLDDVHVFGALTALWGARTAGSAPPRSAAAAGMTAASMAVAVAAGLLPPALAAALLLPWWAPWFGRGLSDLATSTRGWQRTLTLATLAGLAAAVPLLRHAVVVPDAWTAGMTRITRAAATDFPNTAIVTAAEPERLRQLRAQGFPTVPLDVDAVQACHAARRRVHALGDAVTALELAGLRMHEPPVQVPLASVLGDVRPHQLVALGLSSTALPYAGHDLLEALELVGIAGAVPATAQVGAIARIGSLDARVEVSRQGLELRVEPAEPIGGLPLSHPMVVNVQADAAVIDTPPQRLVESRAGALAIVDRHEQLAFRSAVVRRPGLPVSLRSMPPWRRAVVQTVSECVDLGRHPASVGPSRRISVPTLTASPRAPVVAYAVMAAPASVAVSGLPVRSDRPQWEVAVFDRQRAEDRARLDAQLTDDGVRAGALPRGRHVARVALAPTDTWRAARVALRAGVMPAGWVVVAPTAGRTVATGAVCAVPGGDRLLGGQFGVMDDDSLREVPVWTIDGWHRTEHAGRDVFQWSAAPSATLGFRIDTPEPLVLAMEAAPIAGPAGPQALSVRLNGALVSGDWGRPHRVDIAPSMLRPGDNVLELSVPRTVQPPGDPRVLGVLVRQLRLMPAPRS